MSAKEKHCPLLVFVLTVFVVTGLALAAIFYFIYSNDKIEASREIWVHFKALSVFTVGYFYGAK